MTDFAVALHYALSLAGGIDGVSVGRRDDSATWRVDGALDADREEIEAQMRACASPGGFALIDTKGVVHVVVQGGDVRGDLAPNLSLLSLPAGAPALTPLRWYVEGTTLVQIVS